MAIIDRETREAIENLKRDIGNIQRGIETMKRLSAKASNSGAASDNNAMAVLERQVRELGDKVRNFELRPSGPQPTINEEDLIRRIAQRVKQELPSNSNTAVIVEEVLARVRQDHQTATASSSSTSNSGGDLRRLINALTKDMEPSEVLDSLIQEVDADELLQATADKVAGLYKNEFVKEHGQEMPGLVVEALINGTDNIDALELDEDDITEKVVEGLIDRIELTLRRD